MGLTFQSRSPIRDPKPNPEGPAKDPAEKGPPVEEPPRKRAPIREPGPAPPAKEPPQKRDPVKDPPEEERDQVAARSAR